MADTSTSAFASSTAVGFETRSIWSTKCYADRMEVTVQEAKTQLSRLLRRVEAGEEVVIRRGREPVAVLVRASEKQGARHIWGDLRGSMAADFDALPPDFESYA
jgi:prevent-host-death family protein